MMTLVKLLEVRNWMMVTTDVYCLPSSPVHLGDCVLGGLSHKGKVLNYRGAPPTAGKRVIIGTHVEILMHIFMRATREI